MPNYKQSIFVKTNGRYFDLYKKGENKPFERFNNMLQAIRWLNQHKFNIVKVINEKPPKRIKEEAVKYPSCSIEGRAELLKKKQQRLRGKRHYWVERFKMPGEDDVEEYEIMILCLNYLSSIGESRKAFVNSVCACAIETQAKSLDQIKQIYKKFNGM
jgi:hypothetical protein